MEKKTKKVTLYDLTERELELNALIEENDGEITEEIIEQLDQLNADRSAKLERICMFIKNSEAEAEKLLTEAKTFKAEYDRIARRAKAVLARVTSLKNYTLLDLLKNEELKHVAGTFIVAVQNNSQPTVRWLGDSPYDIPEDLRSEPKPPTINSTVAIDRWKRTRDMEAGIGLLNMKIDEMFPTDDLGDVFVPEDRLEEYNQLHDELTEAIAEYNALMPAGLDVVLGQHLRIR